MHRTVHIVSKRNIPLEEASPGLIRFFKWFNTNVVYNQIGTKELRYNGQSYRIPQLEEVRYENRN